jgi:hypothetical protein
MVLDPSLSHHSLGQRCRIQNPVVASPVKMQPLCLKGSLVAKHPELLSSAPPAEIFSAEQRYICPMMDDSIIQSSLES